MAYTLEKTKTPVAAGIVIGTRAGWVCHRDVSERSETRGHAVSSQTRPMPEIPRNLRRSTTARHRAARGQITTSNRRRKLALSAGDLRPALRAALTWCLRTAQPGSHRVAQREREPACGRLSRATSRNSGTAKSSGTARQTAQGRSATESRPRMRCSNSTGRSDTSTASARPTSPRLSPATATTSGAR